MRILQAVHLFPPEQAAGTERYTEILSRVLLTRGHTCFVLAGSYKTASGPGLLISEQDGLSVVRLVGLRKRDGLRTDIFDATAEHLVRKFLTLWCPDLVHLHHWYHLTGNLVAICAEFGIPTVVTLHDQWIACPRIHRIQPDGTCCSAREVPCISCVDRDPWQTDQEVARELDLRRRLITEELKLATCILVPSVAQQQFLQQISDVPLGRLQVVPLGSVATGQAKSQECHERAPAPPLKIGFWGYLTPFKGVHILLEAARLLAEESNGRVEWHLLGPPTDSVYYEKLQRLAEGLPVTFHGPYRHSDVANLDLDIAVFPSLCYETYSFVLDEAFQMGIPVIVPDRGAPADRIGEAGTTFAAGNPKELAQKLRLLLREPEVLERLRRAIPKEGVVNMEAHTADMEKIYQDAASSGSEKGEALESYRVLLQHREQQLGDRELRLSERDAQVAEASHQLMRLTEELQCLQAKLQELIEENLRLHNKLAEREQTLADLRNQVAEQDALLFDLRAQLEARTDEAAALQEQVGNYNHSVADLRNQVAEQDALLFDLRAQVAERDRLLTAARESILGSLDAVLKSFLGRLGGGRRGVPNGPQDMIKKDTE